MKAIGDPLALLWHALKFLVQLIGDVAALAVGLAMPVLLGGAALALAMAATASVDSLTLGRLVMSGTTVLVLIGIVLWAHLEHRWWTT
ncbi:MAG: hypothetical protein ABIQ18_23405 [Umezawaea sp.]